MITQEDIMAKFNEIAEAEYINEQIYGPAEYVVIVSPALVPLCEWASRRIWPKVIIHDLPNEVLHGQVRGY